MTTLYDYMRDDLNSYIRQNISIARPLYGLFYDIETDEIPEGKTDKMLVSRMLNSTTDFNDEEVLEMYKNFKQATGGDFGQESFKYKEVLGEAGRIRASLNTIEKISSYIKNRLRNYATDLNGVRFQKNQGLLLINNESKEIKTVFIQIGKDLENNNFINKGTKKINNKTYVVYEDKLKHQVYLPV